MAKKIYLSPAAHAADNPTKCPMHCGENVHCNQYMDIVERRLRELGFEVRRGSADLTGSAAMNARVQEANTWGADLYYVAHTNAGGGRYSMTMCWTDTPSRQKAEVIGKYRKSIPGHRVKQTGELFEINRTAMPCMYDELFFHDNAEDCAWFHKGGMAIMAEETVQALCEICGVEYATEAEPEMETPKADTEAPEAPPEPEAPKAGDEIRLVDGKLYRSSTGDRHYIRNGLFYFYDGQCINGRYRVTNRPDRVGKKPVGLYVSGWIEL